MTAPPTLLVEVVYAGSECQLLREVRLPEGATVADALANLASDPQFSDLVANPQAVGIFGRLCQPSEVLAAGDRVEIYRELNLDAKAARQRRALEQQQTLKATNR